MTAHRPYKLVPAPGPGRPLAEIKVIPGADPDPAATRREAGPVRPPKRVKKVPPVPPVVKTRKKADEE